MAEASGPLLLAKACKAEGNDLLTSGDYEDALCKYEEGLSLLDASLNHLPPPRLESVREVRLPLLLNSVLCDLHMNTDDQMRRLVTSEQRIAEVLQADPNNLKAQFRRAQLHVRAGEFEEAKSLLEKLCRREPRERTFRKELASLNARMHAAKQETAAFWSCAVKKTLTEVDLDRVESGQLACPRRACESGDGSPLLRRVASRGRASCSVMLAVLRRVSEVLVFVWEVFSKRQSNPFGGVRSRASSNDECCHVL